MTPPKVLKSIQVLITTNTRALPLSLHAASRGRLLVRRRLEPAVHCLRRKGGARGLTDAPCPTEVRATAAAWLCSPQRVAASRRCRCAAGARSGNTPTLTRPADWSRVASRSAARGPCCFRGCSGRRVNLAVRVRSLRLPSSISLVSLARRRAATSSSDAWRHLLGSDKRLHDAAADVFGARAWQPHRTFVRLTRRGAAWCWLASR